MKHLETVLNEALGGSDWSSKTELSKIGVMTGGKFYKKGEDLFFLLANYMRSHLGNGYTEKELIQNTNRLTRTHTNDWWESMSAFYKSLLDRQTDSYSPACTEILSQLNRMGTYDIDDIVDYLKHTNATDLDF